LKCQMGDCPKSAIKGGIYCKEHSNLYDRALGSRHLAIHPHGLTFEEYKEKYLNCPDIEGSALLKADDALLDYEYYKRERRFTTTPNFTPQLSGPYGGDYKEQHQPLESWFLEHFFDLLDQRLRQSGPGWQPGDKKVQNEFFAFRERLNRVNDAIESNNTILGIPDFNPVKILLKKLLRKRDQDPQLLDFVTKAFDSGSAIFYLALFEQLRESKMLVDLEEDIIDFAPGEFDEIIHTPMVMLKPWPHQRDAFSKWSQSGKNGIIEMATATGKTLVGLLAIEDLAKEARQTHYHATVRVIANTQILLNQWRREIVKKMGLPENVNSDYSLPILLKDLAIYFNTTQSVQKSPEDYPAHLLIADEVHNMTGPEYKKALSISCTRKLGLSATIDGETRIAVLDEGLGPIVDTFSITDAMQAGIIPSFTWKVIPVYLAIEEEAEFNQLSSGIRNKFNILRYDKPTLEKLKKEVTPLKDLAEFVKLSERARSRKINLPEDWKILQALIIKRRWIIHKSRPRIEHAIRLAKSLANNHKIIMFAMDIRSCETIGSTLAENTENVFVIHSEMPDSVRDDRIRRFGACTKGILIGAQMLSEGLDFPEVDIGINVAASKTRLQLTQRMGRILRKGNTPNKHPYFYHFVAIPDHASYIPEEDDLAFLDDLAWVQDAALRMGLNAEIIWDEELLKDNIESETVNWFHKTFFKKDLSDITKVGTYNLKYVINQFPESATYRIIRILESLPPDMELTDNQWTRIIRVSSDYTHNKFLNLPGFWWLLILAKRRPDNIIRLFNETHDEIHYSRTDADTGIIQTAVEEICSQNQSAIELCEDERGAIVVPHVENTAAENVPLVSAFVDTGNAVEMSQSDEHLSLATEEKLIPPEKQISKVSIEEIVTSDIDFNKDLSDLFEDDTPEWLKKMDPAKVTLKDLFE